MQFKYTTRLLAVLAAVSLTATLFLATNGQAGMFDKYTSLSMENGFVRIPEAEVNDGVHYYSADVNGKTVLFFVVKSVDGVIRAAFDACDVCFESKKGYSPDGDFVVCNNCGQRFHTSRINLVKGGCNPAPLERVSQDGQVVISEQALAQGVRFF